MALAQSLVTCSGCMFELVVAPTFDQPEFGEPGDHRSECDCGDLRIDVAIGDPLALETSYGRLGALGEVLLALRACLVHEAVVARHLLDDAHDLPVRPVAVEVATVGAQDSLELRRFRRRLVVVVQSGEQGLLGLGDLAEDLFLRVEVVVEGPVRHAGALGDVGDAGLEESGLLELLLGCLDESGPGGCALARARGIRMTVGDLGGARHGERAFCGLTRTGRTEIGGGPVSILMSRSVCQTEAFGVRSREVGPRSAKERFHTIRPRSMV